MRADRIYAIFSEVLNTLVSKGYEISPKQYLYLYSLLPGVPGDFEYRRVKNLICPILAKSFEDQAGLSVVIDNCLDAIVRQYESLDEELEEKEELPEEKGEEGKKEEEEESGEKEAEKEVDPGIQKKEKTSDSRKLRPKRIKGTSSPYVWNIVIEDTPIVTFLDQFNNTFGQLNYRQFLKSSEINVPETIRYAARQGVITDFYYKPRSKRASYLMLIQRDSFQNHESHFYDALYHTLKENDIDIERFFYYSDPRLCWNKKYSNGINLYHIAARYSGSNLILAGNVERIINKKGRLRPWTQVFNVWETKILIPSNSLDAWAGLEVLLSRFFTLVPPLEKEIKLMANYILSNKFEKLKGWKSTVDRQHQEILFKISLLETLNYYFRKKTVDWIAACAIYPALYWDLTLFLGQLISEDGQLITIDNILQLTRLSWFKTGVIPDRAREELLAYLDDTLFERATRAIIDQMKKNPPAPSSPSYDDYSFQLTLYELFLNPSDKDLLARFQELNKMPEVEKDQVLLQHLFQRNNKAREFLMEDPVREANVLSEEGDIRVGQKIDGVVNNITNYGAFVSLHGLFGLIHISEISNEPISHPSEKLSVSQPVTVKIININKENGRITLSLRQVEEEEQLNAIAVGDIFEGEVVSFRNFGAMVDIGNGISGLLHNSEISWSRVEDPSTAFELGQRIRVQVLRKDLKRNYIYFGHKQLLDDPWKAIDESLAEGAVVTGEVARLEDYGAFLEVRPGVYGLVHISEITWNRIGPAEISEYLKVGDTCQAKILSLEKENRKMGLSLKQLTKDPWESLDTEKLDGATVRGKVSRVEPLGAFLEIEPGVEGLIPRYEILWSNREADPSDYFTPGEIREAKVTSIRKKKREIKLSIKRLKQDEWEALQATLEKGDKVTGIVTHIEDRGAWLELAPGLEGFIPKSELSWTEKGIKPGDFFNLRENREAVVFKMTKGQIKLSVRQLEEDPLAGIFEQVNPGSIVKGKVVNIEAGGLWLQLENGIKGFIPRQEVSWSLRSFLLSERFAIGESLNAKVIEAARKKMLVTLSIKRLAEDPWQEGNIFTGRVVAVVDYGLWLEFEDGLEGFVPKSEYSWSKREAGSARLFKVGDECRAKVILSGGNKQLSIREAIGNPWNNLDIRIAQGSEVEGLAVEVNEDGAWLEVEPGMEGFLPASEISWSKKKPLRVEKVFEAGKKYRARVIHLDRRAGDLRLSLRRLQADPWYLVNNGTIKEGGKVSGTAISVGDDGIVIEVEPGIEALLPLYEISWSKDLVNAMEHFQVEDQYMVIDIDREGKRLILSRRQLKENPWNFLGEEIAVGAVVKGKVVAITDDGALVELRPEIEGLVPPSEATWSKKPLEISEYMAVGEQYPVKVLSIDKYRRDLILSYRQAVPHPWENFPKEGIIDSVIQGEVIAVGKEEVVLEIEPGVDGVIPQAEVSWTDEGQGLDEQFMAGDVLKVKVVSVEEKKKQLRLSLKRLTESPWEKAVKSILPGQVIRGRVTAIEAEMVWLEVGPGVRGGIPSSEVSWRKRTAGLNEHFTPGEEYEVKVIAIGHEEQYFKLSIKQLSEDPWKDFVKRVKPGAIFEAGALSLGAKGVEVEVEPGIYGLIPLTEMDWGYPTAELNHYFPEGGRYRLMGVTVDEENRELILSRKALLPNPWEGRELNLKEGHLVKGKITRVGTYGAMLEVEPSVEGLIPLSETRWGAPPEDGSEVFRIGQVCAAKVLEADTEQAKLLLSPRQLQVNPWRQHEGLLKPGRVLKAKVIEIADDHALLEAMPGVCGILSRSEIAWNYQVLAMKDILSVDDGVDVKVVSVNLDNHLLSFSLKQLTPDPWKSIRGMLKVGGRYQGQLKKVERPFAFVELRNKIVGRITLGEAIPDTMLEIGASLEVAVLSIDETDRVLELGSEQLSKASFFPGSDYEIRIMGSNSNGIEVQLADGSTGYSSKKHLRRKDGTDPAEGEYLMARLIKTDFPFGSGLFFSHRAVWPGED